MPSSAVMYCQQYLYPNLSRIVTLSTLVDDLPYIAYMVLLNTVLHSVSHTFTSAIKDFYNIFSWSHCLLLLAEIPLTLWKLIVTSESVEIYMPPLQVCQQFH